MYYLMILISKNGNYNEWLAYGQSKTANIFFSVAFTKLYKSEGILSNVLMPGLIFTNLQRNMADQAKDSLKENPAFEHHLKNVEQGASTSVWVAVAPKLEGVGGRYYENCAQALLKSDEECKATQSGHTAYALNEDYALKLWNISKEWLDNPPK
jgi:NAD(P)-dependent dehydrogenase (short-subunit alcohol dehydrogenase family)